MKKYLIGCLVGSLFSLSAWAETTALFEPATVSLGESTQLIFRSDQPIKDIPDLSRLEGSFSVKGQEQRVQSVTINGRRQARYEIIFNVFPRKKGDLSTGDFTLDGQKVPSATLSVLEGTAVNRLPITFQASVNTTKVYPEETLLYTIKLSDGAGILGGQLTPLTVPNAQVTQLDMDKTYQEVNANGIPVFVFERTYAITPEKSGYLTIPPVELYGSIPAPSQDDPFGMFSQSIIFSGLSSLQKEIRLETNAVQITVLNKPDGWKGWWLPSTQVSLTVQDDFPESIKTGDSLTRTIRLTALGLEAGQLPMIKQPETTGLKVYPSPEKRSTIQTPVGDIQAIEEISLVLVPTNGGELTIPEIRIPWFNTKTGKIEEAFLPAKTISVEGEALPQPTPKVQPVPQKAVVPQEAPVKPVKQAEPVAKESPYAVAGWIALGVLSGLVLGFFIFYRKKKHRSYKLVDKADLKNKKKKKPVPDLYPF